MIDNVFEILIEFFNTAVDNNIKIIHFNTTPKPEFILNDSDYEFLKKGLNVNLTDDVLTTKINFLKDELSKDLFKLDSLQGLSFLILLPNKKNNMFYYDLILGFNDTYNIKDIWNLKLNIVNIDFFYEWSKIDINDIKLRQILNFNKLLFNDYNIPFLNTDVFQYKKITFRKICNHFYSYDLIIDDLHSELADYFMAYHWLFSCIYSSFLKNKIN